jgi:hypothetical protein
MSEENMGEQFKGIAGNSLLSDAKDSIERMQEIVKPYADKVFGEKYMSDKDMLNHPAIVAHNNMYFSHSSIKDAIAYHDTGDWAKAIYPVMKASRHMIDATRGAINLPWSNEDRQEFITNFDKFHAKANDYVNLYGDLER